MTDGQTHRTSRVSRWTPAAPGIFIAALMALAWTPEVHAHARLRWSFLAAVAALLVWNGWLFVAAWRQGRSPTITIELRRQHYLQACAQLAVFTYWGWYWRQVYTSVELIAAQLLFAYAFDMLLTWSRRGHYSLGFGPFPVVFSINLFLWFKPDWFYLQFLMVALAFTAKAFILWTRDGRRTHIFNPSAFPLSVFSIVLILTGSTGITWGPEIADTQFLPPYIYPFLFLIGLPGQFFFGVTSMTMSAVVTMYLFGLAYFGITGTYFFFSYIPIAVFLGMHLLFTDPSTSPRSELGRIIFGMAYAISVLLAYVILDNARIASFYDKLLPVPFLNLAVPWIERLAKSPALARLDPARLGVALAPRQRNLAYMSVWITVFIAMSAAGGVGDTYRAYSVPFWQQACRENRHDACRKLALMENTYCRMGSGYACNDLGVLLATGKYGTNRAAAAGQFRRACDLGFTAGCDNGVAVAQGRAPASASPRLVDYPILLQGGKGPLRDQTPLMLAQRACGQGWTEACAELERAGR